MTTRTSSNPTILTAVAIVAVALVSSNRPLDAASPAVALSPLLLAQGSTSPRDRGRSSAPVRRLPTSNASPIRSQPGASSSSSASPAIGASRERAADPAESASDGGREEGESKSVVRTAKDFITSYKWWIAGALLGVLLLSLLFLFISARGQQAAAEEESIELFPLHADDDEDDGPRRVLIDPATGKPRDMPQRDDSEYALVVDESELELAVEPGSSGEFEKAVLRVQELILQDDFEGAYERYRERVRKHSGKAFHPALERRLGKYFLKKGDLEKAAHVLEHHVATQPASEIESEIWFDLGYIHFKSNTYEKSREFFGVFAERERDPARRERARKLVERLEKVSSTG